VATSPARHVWLDLAAMLDERDDLVAVRLSREGVTARDAYGATVALRAVEPDALAALIVFLDERSRETDGVREDGSPASRFASASLTYNVLEDGVLQLRRWPAAPTWRAACVR
jgi:hypothetical protein